MRIFNDTKGEFSIKRFFFILVSVLAIFLPLWLLISGSITGAEWLDYMKFIVGVYATGYVAGKHIDK